MSTINLGKVVGDDGRGILDIRKTATEGNIDTYTIYYTDETTDTFTVKNGTIVNKITNTEIDEIFNN